MDAPRFGYRGFMLDVARNFQPKPPVLRTLDLLARYKLNVFHFHLTDDEGWRVEMPSLPELTAVGRPARSHARLEPLPAAGVGLGRATWTGRGAAASTRGPTTSRSCATPRRGTSR